MQNVFCLGEHILQGVHVRDGVGVWYESTVEPRELLDQQCELGLTGWRDEEASRPAEKLNMLAELVLQRSAENADYGPVGPVQGHELAEKGGGICHGERRG